MDARMEHATQEFSSSSLVVGGNKHGARAVIRGGSGHEVRSVRGGSTGQGKQVVRGGPGSVGGGGSGGMLSSLFSSRSKEG